VTEIQQSMQGTSCFCNVRSLVLLNPEFLYAYSYVHSEKLLASAVFSSKNPITNASLEHVEFQRTHYAHLAMPYMINAAKSAVVDRFCTADLIGPTVTPQIPCPFHLRPSVALTSLPTKRFATTVTTSNVTDRGAYTHHAQDELLMRSSCVIRNLYHYWYQRKFF
jgi:hypothetical protein